MRERPILFSAPMVRAILAGTKTQTRRIYNGTPKIDGEQHPDGSGETWIKWGRCPYGVPGDRLYVKEQHEFIAMPGGRLGCLYRADMSERVLDAPADFRPVNRGRPSIHMPRWASRITLEIESVRVERLQEISRGDAMDEGCPFPNMATGDDPRHWYAQIWESINGPGSWDANPWVWVLTFRRLDAEKRA